MKFGSLKLLRPITFSVVGKKKQRNNNGDKRPTPVT